MNDFLEGLMGHAGLVVAYDTATGRNLRVGTREITRTLTEGEACFPLPPGESVVGKMVDVATKTLIPLPPEHQPDDSPIIWARVRALRDQILAQTDYLMVLDAPIDDATRARVRAYRQALRDITTQPDPRTVQWPDTWQKDK